MSEIVTVISRKCPKFTKVQLCMIRNPEYGVQLTPEAKKAIAEAGLELKTKYSTPPPRPKRSPPKGPPKKRVSIRLSETEYEKLKEAVKNSGCKSTQEYLEKLLKNKAPG